MLTQLKDAFAQYGIDLTAFPITLDSWFVSQELGSRLWQSGFKKIVLAGKGNYIFTINEEKHPACLCRARQTGCGLEEDPASACGPVGH